MDQKPTAPALPGAPFRMILRATGEVVVLDRRHTIGEIARMISDGEALYTVRLRHPFEFELPTPFRVDAEAEFAPVPPPPRFRVPAGYVLLVRDEQSGDLPTNRAATFIYHAQCREHRDGTVMLGDAALVPDSDFGAVL